MNINGHEYVFEPRLRFAGEGRRNGVAGLYLYRSQQDESIDFPSLQTFDDRVTTAAVSGEGTQPLTSSVDLVVGARYEQEKHQRHGGDQTLVRISLDETYRLTWSGFKGWDARFSARYSSSYYSDLDNLPRGKVDPYFVANAQLGYNFSRVKIYGYVENLFDSDKKIAIYSGATPAEDGADILPPRTYWVGAQVSL